METVWVFFFFLDSSTAITNRLNIIQGDDQIVIKNKVKQNWKALIVYSLGSLFIFAPLGSINNQGFSLSVFLMSLTIGILIGLISIRRFLWRVQGVQKITISNDNLKIEMSGTIFATTKNIIFDDIKSLKIEIDSYSGPPLTEAIKEDQRAMLFTKDKGKIEIRYREFMNTNILSNIDRSEANQIIELIESKINL
ncbi:MAG: hypothetical protein ACI857_002311 [Arenicella sp.]|jgi:hypothetical protein